MKTDASALAVSCFIEALLAYNQDQGNLDGRLAELDLEGEWLQNLGHRYFKYWEQSHIYEGEGARATVHENTVLLLSWLTADTRSPEANLALTAETFKRSQTAYAEATNTQELPAIERLTLTVGVVGRPVPKIDRNFPAWFPGQILEENVEAAYEGLVEHVAGAPQHKWPEIYRTSVLWRLGGIAQGLQGGTLEVLDCMKELNKHFASSLPYDHEKQWTSDEWLKQFRRHRNVFTHVRTENNITFQSALKEHEEQELLLDYIRLASYYVATEINTRISSLEPEGAQRWLSAVDNDQAWVVSTYA